MRLGTWSSWSNALAFAIKQTKNNPAAIAEPTGRRRATAAAETHGCLLASPAFGTLLLRGLLSPAWRGRRRRRRAVVMSASAAIVSGSIANFLKQLVSLFDPLSCAHPPVHLRPRWLLSSRRQQGPPPPIRTRVFRRYSARGRRLPTNLMVGGVTLHCTTWPLLGWPHSLVIVGQGRCDDRFCCEIEPFARLRRWRAIFF